MRNFHIQFKLQIAILCATGLVAIAQSEGDPPTNLPPPLESTIARGDRSSVAPPQQEPASPPSPTQEPPIAPSPVKTGTSGCTTLGEFAKLDRARWYGTC